MTPAERLQQSGEGPVPHLTNALTNLRMLEQSAGASPSRLSPAEREMLSGAIYRIEAAIAGLVKEAKAKGAEP